MVYALKQLHASFILISTFHDKNLTKFQISYSFIALIDYVAKLGRVDYYI